MKLFYGVFAYTEINCDKKSQVINSDEMLSM